MIDQSTPQGRIVAAAMRLAGERDWKELTLLEIAESAGTNLVDLKGHFASKSDILAAFVRNADEEVLRRAAGKARTAGPRDALFDVLMSRFDVLAPYKPALRRIAGQAGFDPGLVRSVLESQRWMLEAAGVSADGASGAVRIGGLATLYGSVFRTWLDDDDPGLARTMAALDRRLRRGERTLSGVREVCAGLGRLARMFAPRRRGDGEPARGPEPAAGGETL